jgi:hypothetical protein
MLICQDMLPLPHDAHAGKELVLITPEQVCRRIPTNSGRCRLFTMVAVFLNNAW